MMSFSAVFKSHWFSRLVAWDFHIIQTFIQWGIPSQWTWIIGISTIRNISKYNCISFGLKKWIKNNFHLFQKIYKTIIQKAVFWHLCWHTLNLKRKANFIRYLWHILQLLKMKLKLLKIFENASIHVSSNSDFKVKNPPFLFVNKK